MAQKPILMTIPGIAGNELGAAWPTPQKLFTFWLSTSTFVIGTFDLLRLDAQGVNPLESWYPQIYPGNGVSYYYGQWADYYRSVGWSVTDAKIDWRRPLSANTQGVLNQLLYLSTFGPVTILAHSRGGLVAQEVCNALASIGRLNIVRKVVTLGTPYGGSYQAVAFLGGWDWLYFYTQAALAVAGTLFRPALATNTQAVVNSWPGLYELLPDPTRAASNGDNKAIELYNTGNWVASGRTVSTIHLGAAHQRWSARPAPPAGMNWTAVVGTGVATRGPVLEPTLLGQTGCLGDNLDGDGVVPMWSASCAGYPSIPMATDHQGFVSNPTFFAQVNALLQA